jgi:enoyl-CoA hydratase/carnithine racemase
MRCRRPSSSKLGAAVDAVAADQGARVLIVTGNGSAFSAGADSSARGSGSA